MYTQCTKKLVHRFFFMFNASLMKKNILVDITSSKLRILFDIHAL